MLVVHGVDFRLHATWKKVRWCCGSGFRSKRGGFRVTATPPMHVTKNISAAISSCFYFSSFPSSSSSSSSSSSTPSSSASSTSILSTHSRLFAFVRTRASSLPRTRRGRRLHISIPVENLHRRRTEQTGEILSRCVGIRQTTNKE